MSKHLERAREWLQMNLGGFAASSWVNAEALAALLDEVEADAVAHLAALEAALEDAARQMEHLRDIDNNDDGEVARKAGAYANTIRERLRHGTAALDAMLERAVREAQERAAHVLQDALADSINGRGYASTQTQIERILSDGPAAIVQRVKEGK